MIYLSLFMSRREEIPIQRLMNIEQLNRKIKTVEKDVKILKRLYFIKFRYNGDSVEKAAEKVGVTKRIGYIWQDRWNDEGYDGIIPRYAGGRPSKLSEHQKNELEQILRQKEIWSTKEIKELISRGFNVNYSLKQVYIILRNMGMSFGKPYPRDYRRPPNAEEMLKKTS
jgi:putative transposase